MNQKSDIDIEATLEKFRHWLSEARASGDATAAREPNSNSARTHKYANSGSSI